MRNMHDTCHRTVLNPVVVRAVCLRSREGAKVKSGYTTAASEIEGVACKHPRHKLTVLVLFVVPACRGTHCKDRVLFTETLSSVAPLSAFLSFFTFVFFSLKLMLWGTCAEGKKHS